MRVDTISLMKLFSLIVLFTSLTGLFGTSAYCEGPITVAVIDTGFGFQNLGHQANLCKYGHKDFSADKKFSKDYGTADPIPVDLNSHGTNIVGVIDQYAGPKKNYCIVVLKYFSEKHTGQQNLNSFTRAVKYATNIKAKFINYSGGGPNFDLEEYNAIEKFLNQGGKFIAAAGNEHSDLVKNHYYPAVYDPRIVVVGNRKKAKCKLTNDQCRSATSNYGIGVTRWEVGEDVTAYGITMTGTSQATAIATGKIVSESK